jgi:hypothetical protein
MKRRRKTESKSWIGVDLNGVLAHYEGWKGVTYIGAPVPKMVARVKGWLAAGEDVRILTARITNDGTTERMLEAAAARREIENWCAEHLGQRLVVTCQIDYKMKELWNDRAVQVIQNTGRRVGSPQRYPTSPLGRRIREN